MSFEMPRVLQTPSPNFTPTLIAHDLFFFHMCEGSGAGSVAWLCKPNVQASSHMVMSEDGSIIWQLVPLQFKAWAEEAFNSKGVSLEIPGFTAQGIPEARWRAAALIAAWYCRAYGVPVQWARGGQERGICQHADLGAAGGGHHDACPIGGQVWLALMEYVQEAYNALGDGPLPSFALHGAPGPHEIVAPPAVPPEPSHGGVPRIDPPPKPAAPPADGVARRAWIQEYLNFHKASPQLIVDGVMGDDTEAAIAAYLARS